MYNLCEIVILTEKSRKHDKLNLYLCTVVNVLRYICVKLRGFRSSDGRPKMNCRRWRRVGAQIWVKSAEYRLIVGVVFTEENIMSIFTFRRKEAVNFKKPRN